VYAAWVSRADQAASELLAGDCQRRRPRHGNRMPRTSTSPAHRKAPSNQSDPLHTIRECCAIEFLASGIDLGVVTGRQVAG
jgi:hypothetical protein